MSFTRVKPGSWGVFEKLTSAQMNTLDTDHSNSLDIRSAQTNSLQSITTLAGTGRVIASVANGPDADTTITAGNGNNAVWVGVSPAITASRTYTMSNSSAVAWESVLFFLAPAVTSYEITIKDASSTTLFVLGNKNTSDGEWCEVFYTGSAWVLWRKGQGSRTFCQTFSSSGTWTVPPGVSTAIAFGCGGGGGGGFGGADGTFGVNRRASGGGGGGASIWGAMPLFLTPGNTMTVTIGAGGAGGTVGSPEGDGGADTSLGTSCRFSGAHGGGTGDVASASDNSAMYSLGGPPGKVSFFASPLDINYGSGWNLSQAPGTLLGGGGGSFAALTGAAQYGSHNAGALTFALTNGGAPGTTGTDSSSYRGGVGGGGGGAGPNGDGGAGGAGGNANGAGTGANGVAGSSAAANSGAGGGGGGAGGNGSAAAGAGADGGAGGSGLLVLMWVK